MCVFFRCVCEFVCMYEWWSYTSVQCACVQQYTCVYMYASLYHMLLEINLP